MPALEKLFEISSPSTGEGQTTVGEWLPPELRRLLDHKNGFFAFEAALEVFPLTESSKSYSIREWNKDSLWRCYYGNLMPHGNCFAQNIFGDQFIYSDAIYQFNPETAELSFIARSIEMWAKIILDDYNFFLGYGIAHDWQKLHGAIPFYHRLVPKIPFVLGGEYDVDNLDAFGSSEGMIARADLAVQLKNIPDGSKVTFSIDD